MGKGGGGGGLRILPHKSWHVWNFENLQKFEHDEMVHAAEEEEKLKKTRGEESVARMDTLRGRSHKRKRDKETTLEDMFSDPTGSLKLPMGVNQLTASTLVESSKSFSRNHMKGSLVKSQAVVASSASSEALSAHNQQPASQFMNFFADEEAKSEAEKHRGKRGKKTAESEKALILQSAENFFKDAGKDSKTGSAPWYANSQDKNDKLLRLQMQKKAGKHFDRLKFGPMLKQLKSSDSKTIHDPLVAIKSALGSSAPPRATAEPPLSERLLAAPSSTHCSSGAHSQSARGEKGTPPGRSSSLSVKDQKQRTRQSLRELIEVRKREKKKRKQDSKDKSDSTKQGKEGKKLKKKERKGKDRRKASSKHKKKSKKKTRKKTHSSSSSSSDS